MSPLHLYFLYVDSGVLNHMTSPYKWFNEILDLKKPSFVETRGYDTAYPIAHIRDMSLSMQDYKIKYLVDVNDLKN